MATRRRALVASVLATASLAAWSAAWGPVAVAGTTLVVAGLFAWWLPRAGRDGEHVGAGILAAASLLWASSFLAVAAVHLVLSAAILVWPRASGKPAKWTPRPEATAVPRAPKRAKPVTAPPLQPPATRPPSPPRTSRSGRAMLACTRVLLVDDNPANRFYGTLLLKRLGHEVEVASTGEQAVELAGHQRFDVVLMDLRMPGMDGLEATRALRRRLPPHACPFVVALTADDRPEERERLLHGGMDAFLAKPLQADQLTEVLKRASGSLVAP